MPEKAPESNGNGKDKIPLWQKMYSRDSYIELVRIVGYAGISVTDGQAKMKPLADKFGKEKMAAIAEELVRIDPSTTPPTARLKDDVRKLAWQLLGRPPEFKETSLSEMIGRNDNRDSKDDRPVKPNKPRKPRAKKTPAGLRQATSDDVAKVLKPAQSATNGNAIVNKIVNTPIMAQYCEAKERHPNMLLLFRMGDFYEMFDSDARTGARILGLTLTSRDKTTDMAGFPHHQLETYLRKLLKEGIRVAVCDQVDSNDGKRVNREVTRVVMPAGTVDETTKEVLEVADQLAKGPLDSLDSITDDALFAREYELRKILDRDKTKAQRKEADKLSAEIKRRAKAG